MTTTTPNMSLIEPDVLSTPSPTWASLLNNALTTIDSHDHSTGKGVKITPSGLNISSDLPFGSNNATTLRSVRLNNQTSFTPTSNDLACIYVLNNEIYYRDGVGNVIQITSGGSLNTAGFSLSSLSIRDSAFTLQYFADLTKQVKFDLSAITTGTTRTISIPDATSTLVNLISTQTLSNKSFDSTAVNIRSAQPINFYNSGNTFYTGVKAGNNSSNLNLTLPISSPTAGQVLISSDIAGTLGWANTTTTVGGVSANDSNVTFTNADNRSQTCNPTAARTYTLPTTSITAGDTWEFFNRSNTNNITLNASGGALVDYCVPSGYIRLRALVNTPTAAADWQVLQANSSVVSYTPSAFGAGFGTTTGVSFKWYRQGDKMKCFGNVTFGTPASNYCTIAIPSPFTIDTSKVVLNVTQGNVSPQVGTNWMSAASANQVSAIVLATSTTTTAVYLAVPIGGANNLIPSAAAGNFIAGETCSLMWEIPISNWGG